MPEKKVKDLRAFSIHPDDNVATAMDDITPGAVCVLGEAGDRSAQAIQAIPAGHKIATRRIRAGQPVIKYGHRIGHASVDILVGEWVHLHNLKSDVDERSGSLDIDTGAPTDTPYI